MKHTRTVPPAGSKLINNSFKFNTTHIHILYTESFRLDRTTILTNEGEAKRKSAHGTLFKLISSSVNDGMQRNSFIPKYAGNYISLLPHLLLLLLLDSNFII